MFYFTKARRDRERISVFFSLTQNHQAEKGFEKVLVLIFIPKKGQRRGSAVGEFFTGGGLLCSSYGGGLVAFRSERENGEGDSSFFIFSISIR